MASLEVRPVIGRREQKQFIDLAWDISASDPNWVPPLIANQRELLHFKNHPFYQQAEIQTFLAHRDGKPVGRVAALVNHGHNERYNERRGFFGFFESINDREVAHGLFDAAKAWLAERNVHAIRGPANPSLNYECGLLIEGFESPPFFMMTHNPPYYGELIESYGFQKSQDMFAFWGRLSQLQDLDPKLKFIVDEATSRFRVETRTMTKKSFREDVQKFLEIYNSSLQNTWGFVPLSSAEMEHMAKGLRHLIVPELTVVAEVDGKPVGASFALLDYNTRIKKINGRLFPFGFIKLLGNRRAIKRMRVISTNVIPEYQRWGLGLVVMRAMLPGMIDWGMDEVEFSWVLESNDLSRKTLEKGGAKRTKTYRMYDYPSE